MKTLWLLAVSMAAAHRLQGIFDLSLSKVLAEDQAKEETIAMLKR